MPIINRNIQKFASGSKETKSTPRTLLSRASLPIIDRQNFFTFTELNGINALIPLSVSIVILTYNAEPWARRQIAGLTSAGVSPGQVVVVDSASRDRTTEIFKEYGARIIEIQQSEFNHGATRRMAATLLSESDFLVYLTQDAIPADADSFTNILSAFNDPKVGMAYGRQLPRPESGPIEAHARLFNYPDISKTVAFSDRATLGAKATFASDSFAAYRTHTLLQVGNFPGDSFFAEDQIVAARMLMKGYAKAYVSDACVYHSHRYTVVDDFKRYFDVGAFHARNRWLTQSFGLPESEGKRFVLSEIRYLSRVAPYRIPDALIRTIVKYIGYRIGKMERRLSPQVKRKLSSSSYYWLTH